MLKCSIFGSNTTKGTQLNHMWLIGIKLNYKLVWDELSSIETKMDWDQKESSNYTKLDLVQDQVSLGLTEFKCS